MAKKKKKKQKTVKKKWSFFEIIIFVIAIAFIIMGIVGFSKFDITVTVLEGIFALGIIIEAIKSFIKKNYKDGFMLILVGLIVIALAILQRYIDYL